MDFGKRAGKIFKSLLLIIVVFICFFCLNNERQEELEMQMMEFVNPFCGYIESPKTKVCSEAFLDKMNFFVMGLLGYMDDYPVYAVQSEDAKMIDWILLKEARDENEGEVSVKTDDEPHEPYKESVSENEMQAEEEADDIESENEKKRNELLLAENSKENDARRSESIWKSDEERVKYYESLKDYDTLIKEFYQIDKTTSITKEQLDAQKMLGEDLSMKTPASKPQILIYHTHSQEAFADSVAGDKSTTIVGAGERLAELLREYGFNVIHHTGEYDVESRDYAYSNAAPAVEKILEENPSIEVIIDLHRDGVAEDTHLVTEVDGVKMAQFMLFNGLSRTNATGDIDYLKNPYINENLAFSFQLQLKAKEYYPEMVRKIYLKGYRYNMHYRGKSMLLELGAQTNTVEEIMNALPPIAHIISMVLNPS